MKFHDDRCKGKAVMRRKPKCGRTDGQTDGQTDRRTDRRTDMVIPVYPLTSLRGYNYYRKHVLIFNFGLYKPFISFLQKSVIFISNSWVSLKTVNCDRLQRSRNVKLVSFQRADTAVIF